MRKLPAASPISLLVVSGFAVAWLGSFATPASAASGVDILCDDSDGQPVGLEVAVESLAVDVVDHGNTDSVTPDAPAAAAISSRAEPVTEMKSSSVRETNSDLAEVGSSDVPTRDDSLPGPGSRFPGVSDDEALRYRSQMYRTDI